MNTEKINVYLLGTRHDSNKSKNDIEDLVKNLRFDCFLTEGVCRRGAFNSKNLLKEPFFLIGAFIWFYYLQYFGKDVSTLHRISEEKGIPLYLIDKTLSELVDEGHRWCNYPLYFFVSLVLFFALFQFPLIFRILITIIFLLAFSLGYIQYKVNNMREETWITKIICILRAKKYRTVLVTCGENHKKNIKEKLIAMDFRVITENRD